MIAENRENYRQHHDKLWIASRIHDMVSRIRKRGEQSFGPLREIVYLDADDRWMEITGFAHRTRKVYNVLIFSHKNFLVLSA